MACPAEYMLWAALDAADLPPDAREMMGTLDQGELAKASGLLDFEVECSAGAEVAGIHTTECSAGTEAAGIDPTNDRTVMDSADLVEAVKEVLEEGVLEILFHPRFPSPGAKMSVRVYQDGGGAPELLKTVRAILASYAPGSALIIAELQKELTAMAVP